MHMLLIFGEEKVVHLNSSFYIPQTLLLIKFKTIIIVSFGLSELLLYLSVDLVKIVYGVISSASRMAIL